MKPLFIDSGRNLQLTNIRRIEKETTQLLHKLQTEHNITVYSYDDLIETPMYKLDRVELVLKASEAQALVYLSVDQWLAQNFKLPHTPRVRVYVLGQPTHINLYVLLSNLCNGEVPTTKRLPEAACPTHKPILHLKENQSHASIR